MRRTLYDELGVGPTADEAAIRAGYRRAAKRAHPDAGGSAAAWERVSRALAVLTDPAARARYDETGDETAPRVATIESEAMEYLAKHFVGAMSEWIASGFQSADPRQRDLLEELRLKIAGELSEHKRQIAQVEKIQEAARDYRSRVSRKQAGSDPVRGAIDQKIAEGDRAITGLRRAVQVRERARELAKDYDYRHDEPEEDPYAASARTIFFTLRT